MKIKVLCDQTFYAHDLALTREFYKEFFELEPIEADSKTLIFESGLSFKCVSPWVAYIGEREHRLLWGNRTPEIVLTYPGAKYKKLYRTHTNREDARIIVDEKKEGKHYYRIYDPDNHLIEVQESIFE